jgi:acyl-coenzyme A thioesterase PaaI-like protein
VTDLSADFVVPFERSFDALYGLEHLGAGDGEARGRVTVRRRHLGEDGTVRSGFYAAIAESLASTGTAVEVLPAGLFPSGLSNSTHVVGAVGEDTMVEAVARCRARGELEWIWDVEIVPVGGQVAALATVAIAVRKNRFAARQTG